MARLCPTVLTAYTSNKSMEICESPLLRKHSHVAKWRSLLMRDAIIFD